jgi:hypothetical protein
LHPPNTKLSINKMKRINITYLAKERGLVSRNKNNHTLIAFAEDSANVCCFGLITEILCFLVLILCVCVIFWGISHVVKDDHEGKKRPSTHDKRLILEVRVSSSFWLILWQGLLGNSFFVRFLIFPVNYINWFFFLGPHLLFPPCLCLFMKIIHEQSRHVSWDPELFSRIQN